MIKDAYTVQTAEKILQAATQLFALYGYDSVSIKQITELAGVNSALISYYYRGKKNLYLSVLSSQMEVFKGLIEAINAQKITPLEKLMSYVNALAKFQSENPNHVQLIYREILSPQPMFEDFVKTKLYCLHIFMKDLVAEAVKVGELKTNIAPTHVAFTLEGIILFYFLMHREIRELGDFHPGEEEQYLDEALTSYLKSLK